ncbi:DUF6520 family protein [Flavitalea flava]
MKKIKFSLMSLAIIVSICGAFATRPSFDCRTATQYYYNGTAYIQTGTYGIGYICMAAAGVTCTYTYDSGTQTYTGCRTGNYTPSPTR